MRDSAEAKLDGAFLVPAEYAGEIVEMLRRGESPYDFRESPMLAVSSLTVILAGFLLVMLLAIAALALGYELGKLRGDRDPPPAISSPAPAGHGSSDGPPADAAPFRDVARMQA